jgi:hypothetical protein
MPDGSPGMVEGGEHAAIEIIHPGIDGDEPDAIGQLHGSADENTVNFDDMRLPHETLLPSILVRSHPNRNLRPDRAADKRRSYDVLVLINFSIQQFIRRL